MPSTQPTILAFGEVLWDLFPEGPCFGGAAANFACHAAALGAKTGIASAVGDDPRGERALAILRNHQVGVGTMQVVEDRPTGTVHVVLDSAGKPSFTIDQGVAWDRIAWTPEIETSLAGAEAIYFGTLVQRSSLSRQTIIRSLKIAEATGTTRVLDVNLRAPFFDDELIRSSISLASIVKLSDDELHAVASACGITIGSEPEITLRELLDTNDLDLVVMTRGAAGALLVSPSETIDQPGIPTEVRDTVGAGDAFTAALVTGLLEGDPLTEIAHRACELAAYVCSIPGAVPESSNL